MADATIYGQLISSSTGSGTTSAGSGRTAGVSTDTFSCTNVWVTPVSGSDTQFLGYFRFGWYQAADHYEAQWYYLNDKDKWVADSVQTVSRDAYVQRWDSGVLVTDRQTRYTIPSGVTVKSVKFRVRPVSGKRDVAVGQNKDGSTKYENNPYFTKTSWAWSPAHANTAALAAPDAPTSLAAALSGTKAKLTWTCSSALATHVVVYRSKDGGTWGTVAKLERKQSGSWTDATCAVGHYYTYRLRALNGKSNKYSPYTSTVRVDEKPSRPKNLKASLVGTASVRLTWDNTGHTGSGYVVYYCDSLSSLKNNGTAVQTKSLDGTMTRCQIDNLERGKTWYFRLKRNSSAGLSDFAYTSGVTASSKPVTVSMKLAADPSTVTTTPTKPTMQAVYVDSAGNLRIVATVTGHKGGEKWEIQTVTVNSWTSDTLRTVTVEDAPKAVRRKNSNNAYGYGTAATGYTSVGTGVVYVMSDPKPGTRYWARARRVNDKKQSAWSSTMNALVPAEQTTPAAAKPTLGAVYADGAYLKVVFGNAGARADETSEIQLSTVSSSFSDDGVRTVTYDGKYRTVYGKGEKWSYKGGTGWSQWNNGVIYTVTSVEEGTKYWVRVRRKNSEGTASAWSSVLSATIPAIPEEGVPTDVPTAPTGLTCAAQSAEHPENVRLDWSEASASTTCAAEYATYEVQWTRNAGAFADNAAGDIQSATYETETPKATSQHYTVTGLDRGEQWWFRVRKTNELGNGEWASAKAGATYSSATVCTIVVEPEAEVLSAPTTVATLAGYELGDVINLSWTHNSEQDSEQTAWEVGIRVTIDEVSTEGALSGEDATNVIAVDLGELEIVVDGSTETITIPDGTLVEWRVRTQGVVDWSPWSGWRQFFVWSPPSVTVGLLDGSGADVADHGLTSMPLTVCVSSSGAAEANQPIEWWAEVAAAEDYDVDAYDGSGSHVGAGTVLWRDSIASGADGFDPDGWDRVVSVAELRLMSGVAYEVRAGAATAQGIRASATPAEVTPQWASDVPDPTAEVNFDTMQYSCHVVPVCMAVPGRDGMDSATATVSELPATIDLDAALSEDAVVCVECGDEVLAPDTWEVGEGRDSVTVLEGAVSGLPKEVTVLFAEPAVREGTLIDVYRIDASGQPLALVTGLDNDGSQEVVDPHCTYGESTYRIVATDESTGQQGACEVSCPTPIDNVTIQWGEGVGIDDDETWGQASFAGKRIDMPIDLKVTETYAPDVVAREYAGRRHPVVYFGTQRGQTATLASNVVRDFDPETVVMLRRMADAMEPVYVRTPNGLGFWAHVKPTFTTAYNSGAVAVSLEVTRVETPEGEVP